MNRPVDDFPILAIDYLQFYVGNAKQAAHYYRALGFTPIAYMGLETGSRDRVSWALRQGDITFVFTGALGGESEITEHVRRHGDGVHDVALRVPDTEEAYRIAISRGATAVAEPEVFEDEHGKVVKAAYATYGETIHSLVSRRDYSGPFFPGFLSVEADDTNGFGLQAIDHVVGNVELGKMNEWVSFYERIMGFTELRHFSDDEISTEYSTLMSKVVWDGEGKIKLPINEPAEGKRKSQIEEYLEYYGTPGVQHIAMATEDIVTTVESMHSAGIEFLRVPATYYEDAKERVPEIADQIEALARNGILADKDEEGYLLQIFTKPVQDRPTVFFEVIERHGSRGFGAGNFKALFEAIEREQDGEGEPLMDVVHSKGKVTRQAHVGVPEGTYEEEHGRETFFGRASHLYRTHPPTAWTRIEGPLRPRALNLNEVKPQDQAEPDAGWALVAGNSDVRLYISRRTEPMPYFLRDADGDVCYFVHRGEGSIETDYGPLTFKPGDYVIVPKGTTHRVVPTGDDNFFLVIEGTGEFHLPDRGLMGKHAQFDPGVMEVPEPDPHDEAGEFEVRVKRDGDFTSLFFAWHPLDVVGWQGDLSPVKLNILDHRPVYSPSYHMPPSAHCTFANEGFVICSFVPRPLEEDPAVLKVPFYHANIDADEVLFYHAGNFFSRADIDVGFMTLHPQGVHHGPQPAAIEASKTKTRTDEIAVMIETHNPLELSPEAEAVIITEYETSWARGMGLVE